MTTEMTTIFFLMIGIFLISYTMGVLVGHAVNGEVTGKKRHYPIYALLLTIPLTLAIVMAILMINVRLMG